MGNIFDDVDSRISSSIDASDPVPPPVQNATAGKSLSVFDQVESIANTPKPQEPRSALGELGTAWKRGTLGVLPEMAGQALQWGTESPVTENIIGKEKAQGLAHYGKSLAENRKAYLERPENQLHPEDHSAVTNTLAQGAEMIPSSIVPALAVGAGVALLPEALTAGGIGLGLTALGGAVPMGMAQAQQTKEAVMEAGGTEEAAETAGWKSGAIETAGETLGTYIGGKFLGFGKDLLGIGAGKTISSVIGQATNKEILRPFAKALVKTAIGETLTEMGQNYGQATVEKNAGVNTDPIEQAKASILPTLGMTAWLAPFGLHASYRRSQHAEAVDNALNDPKATEPETRAEIVNALYESAKENKVPDADQWRVAALEDVAAGRPIRRSASTDPLENEVNALLGESLNSENTDSPDSQAAVELAGILTGSPVESEDDRAQRVNAALEFFNDPQLPQDAKDRFVKEGVFDHLGIPVPGQEPGYGPDQQQGYSPILPEGARDQIDADVLNQQFPEETRDLMWDLTGQAEDEQGMADTRTRKQRFENLKQGLADRELSMEELEANRTGRPPTAEESAQAFMNQEQTPAMVDVEGRQARLDDAAAAFANQPEGETDGQINKYPGYREIGSLPQGTDGAGSGSLVSDGKTDGGSVQQGDIRTTGLEGGTGEQSVQAAPKNTVDNPSSIVHGKDINLAPTEAQKEAENYKTAKASIDGLSLSIENPAGSVRSGKDASGKEWSQEMKADYGRILGSKGYDKDHVDIMVKPGYQGGADNVYVVNQHKADGSFDEHKVVAGVNSEQEALALYNSSYEAGWTGGKSVTRIAMPVFKKWVSGKGPSQGVFVRERTVFSETKSKKDTFRKPTFGMPKVEFANAETKATVSEKSPYQMTPKEYTAGITDTDEKAIRLAAHPRSVKEALRFDLPVPLPVLQAYSNNQWAKNGIAKLYPEKMEQKQAGDETASAIEIIENNIPNSTTPKKDNIVEHVTKKGKTIRGIVRTDITWKEAKAIDKFTFKKDGGWFIREQHLTGDPGGKTGQTSENSKTENKTSSGTENQNVKGLENSGISIPRGKTGEMLAEGDVRLTATGRQTSPFPKVATDSNRKAENTLKRVDRWLMENALAEAESRGDNYNARMFRHNLEKPSQSDKDSAEMYLFDEVQPKVVPSILKDLVTPEQKAQIEANSTTTEDRFYPNDQVVITNGENKGERGSVSRFVQIGRQKPLVSISLENGESFETTSDNVRLVEERPEADPKSTLEQLQEMSDDDIDNLFDEVDQERAAEKPPKTAEPPKPPREPKAPIAPRPPKSNPPSPPAPKKTAGQIVKEGGIAAQSAVKDAMAGLTALFGDPNTIRMGPAFDEETYRKAKPHFVNAWNGVKDLGYSVKELINYFYGQFGDKIRPYLQRFVKDVRNGNLEVELTEKPNKSTLEERGGEPYADNENQSGEGKSVRADDEAAAGPGDNALEGMASEGSGGTGSGRAPAGGSAQGGRKNAGGNKKPDAGGVSAPRGGRGDVAEVHSSETGEGSGRGDGKRVSGPATTPAVNFRITEDVRLGQGGETVKFNDNLAAIKILKKLESEKRRATPDEQRALARYVGWGGLANSFRNGVTGEVKSGWEDRVAELEKILTPEELAVARNSTKAAHYTSFPVVNAMWKAVERMGFKGGNVLEPSVGVGNFLGLMPESLAGNTNMMAVEYDNITAGIAKHLYPNAAVFHSGFQDLPLPENSFDLVIGNPPFGQDRLNFPHNPDLNPYTIHHQFFLAGMDALKPGGLQVMVVSRYLMDGKDTTVRKLLAGKGKLLAAIRLPDTAFKENAKTDVVTDVLFLQKYTERELSAMETARETAAKQKITLPDPEWVETTTIPDPLGGEPMRVNAYFKSNPAAVIGRLERSGSMRGSGTNVNVKLDKSEDIAARLDKIIKTMPADIAVEVAPADKQAQYFKNMVDAMKISLSGQELGSISFNEFGELEQVIDRETDGGDTILSKRVITPSSPWSSALSMDKDGKWFRDVDKVDEKGAKVKVVVGDKATKRNQKTREVFEKESDIPANMKLGEPGYNRLRDSIQLLETLTKQINLETSDSSEKEMESNRAKLRRQYDAYVKEHSHINDRKTANILAGMPNSALLLSLESKYKPPIDKDKAKKLGIAPQQAMVEQATILSKRVISPVEKATTAATPADALAINLSETGRISLERVAELLGKSEDETVKALHDDLDTPLIFFDPETDRWEPADEYLGGNVVRKMAAAKAKGLEKNAKALEKVLPEPWTADKVTATIGGVWIPADVYADFLSHLTKSPAEVKYFRTTNTFHVQGRTAGPSNWGTQQRSPVALVDAILNNRPIKVTYTDHEGKTHVDQEATDAAIAKAAEIKDEFDAWVFKDSDRRNRLVKIFNDKFNVRVTKQRDGQHLQFPGKVPDAIIAMRRHQKNAIWRGIVDNVVLFDHAVGSGKTFTSIARALERKRMGLSRKPMIVVPNHLVEQFAKDVYKLYPGAKLLAAGKSDLVPAKRRRIFAKIATGDWDMVIVPHSSFQFIGISPATETRYLEAELAIAEEAVKEALAETGHDGGSFRKPLAVKEAEALRDKIKNRLAQVKEKSGKKDRLLTFEQLGVDDLTVDEEHDIGKNLFYTSSLNVRGMGPKGGSGKAYDLWTKTRVLHEMKNGSIAFMTGTPISNSAVEMYTLMRYLVPELLEEHGLEHFDAWRNNFASVNSAFEPTDSGKGLKEVSRLGRDWTNTRSLMDLYYTFADCVSNDDIQKWYAEDNNGAQFPLPKVKGGGRVGINVKPTPAQRGIIEDIISGFDGLESITDPKERNKARLRLMDRARKVSLDARAARPGIDSNEEGGKLSRVSDEVVRLHRKWTAEKGTQLIFLDRSVPKAKGDDKIIKTYDELMAKLEAAERTGDEAAIRRIGDSLERFDPVEIEELRIAQAGGWNAYQQIKDNLVERGIPANEIRFIQEADTDEKKKFLFEEVNSGAVRVLIGSTPRMGAGTNVQERLVGLHHVDVTWKPSDIEQREGRIIRQGNRIGFDENGNSIRDNFEVEILAYTTDTTVDAKMWALNSTKLKMINGIRQYDGSFTMEFDDTDAVGMAEIAAIASGEPLQLERVQLSAEIDKLERLKRAHERQRWAAEDTIHRMERTIETAPAMIKELESAAKTVEKATADERRKWESATVDIDGTTYGGSDARKALDKLIEESKKEGAEPFSVTIDGKKYRAKVKAEDALHAVLGDAAFFAMKINGKSFKQRGEATKEVVALANAKLEQIEKQDPDFSESDEIMLGTVTVHGIDIDLSMQVSMSAVGYEKHKVVDRKKQVEFFFERRIDLPGGKQSYLVNQSYASTLAANRAHTAMPSLFRGTLDTIEDISSRANNEARLLATAEKDLPTYKEVAGKPFAKEDDLKQKGERLTAVERELESRKKSNASEDAVAKEVEKAKLGVEYSKSGGTTTGRTVAQLEDELRSTIGEETFTSLVESGAVDFVGTQEEALKVIDRLTSPEILHSEDGRTIQGFTDGTKSWLVADGIQKGRAGDVLNHEVGVHLRKLMLKDREYQAIERSLSKRQRESGRTGRAIRAAMARVPKSTKSEHYWSEVMAYMVEDAPESGVVRRIMAAAKKILIRVFGNRFVNYLSVDDLRVMAISAVKRGGDIQGSNMAAPMFSEKVLQAISSAATSLNQVPALFKKNFLKPGTVNVDIGGGKYDAGTEYLKEQGIKNLVYDPFNRSAEHNQDVVKELTANRTDTATVNNVLNVIKEKPVRLAVIRQAAKAIKADGTAYFQIHEGDGDGNSRVTKVVNGAPASWQNHQKTAWYEDEVRQYFGEVTRKGNVLIAMAPVKDSSMEEWSDGAGNPLFSFAGKNATTADTGKLAKAQEMKAAGKPREDIWKETGWWEIVPGQWSFELDDSLSSLEMRDGKLSDVLKDRGLFQAYPFLKGVNIAFRSLGPNRRGIFSPQDVTIYVNSRMDNEAARSTVHHEIQHIIQRHEGFAGGTSYKESPNNSYYRQAGEVEARLVQFRRNMTPAARKAQPPWVSMEKMLKAEGLLKEGQDVRDVLLKRSTSPDTLMFSYQEARNTTILNAQVDGEVSNASLSYGEKLVAEIMRKLAAVSSPAVANKRFKGKAVDEAIEAFQKARDVINDPLKSAAAKQQFAAVFVNKLPPVPRAKLLNKLSQISRVKDPERQQKRLRNFLTGGNKALAEFLRDQMVSKLEKAVAPLKMKKDRVRRGRGAEFERDLKYLRTVAFKIGTGPGAGVEVQLEQDRLTQQRLILEDQLQEAKTAEERARLEEKLADTESFLNLLSIFGGIEAQSFDEVVRAYRAMADFLEEGRAPWRTQLETWKERNKANKKQLLQVVTGEDDPKPETLAEKSRREAREKSFTGRAQEALSATSNSIQSWELLMDKISRKSGAKTLQSWAVKHFGSIVHKATRDYERMQMEWHEKIMEKAVEIFGVKDNAKLAKEFAKLSQQVEGKVFVGAGESRQSLTLSPLQAAYWYQISRDIDNPAVAETFEGMGINDETLDQIEELIGPKLKAWADYLVSEFYQEFHTDTNEVYRQVYGIDLDKTANYVPWRREVTGKAADKEKEGMLAGMESGSIKKGSLRARVKNTKPFKMMNLNDILVAHIADMNHFKAWAIPTREINGTFNSPTVQKFIRQHYGASTIRTIRRFQDRFVRSDREIADDLHFLDKIRGNVTRAMVGLNPVVFLKQLTALPSYMADIPMDAWFKHTGYALRHPVMVARILGRSTMIKARYQQGFERDVATAMKLGGNNIVARHRRLTDSVMVLVQLGDKVSVLMGGYAVYKHHLDKLKAAGMSHREADKQALEEFEMATERSQQSGAAKDLGWFQSGTPIMKLFTMFMTAPASYSRQIFMAVRNMKADPKDSAKRLFVFGVLMPVIFQAIADALMIFGGDDDDEERFWKNQAKALALGPFQGLPIIRTMIEGYAQAINGQYFHDEFTPVAEAFSTSKETVSDFFKFMQGGTERISEDEYLERSLLGLVHTFGYMTGVPTKPLQRTYSGVYDAATGETEHPIRRVIGYSKYVVGENE